MAMLMVSAAMAYPMRAFHDLIADVPAPQEVVKNIFENLTRSLNGLQRQFLDRARSFSATPPPTFAPSPRAMPSRAASHSPGAPVATPPSQDRNLTQQQRMPLDPITRQQLSYGLPFSDNSIIPSRRIWDEATGPVTLTGGAPIHQHGSASWDGSASGAFSAAFSASSQSASLLSDSLHKTLLSTSGSLGGTEQAGLAPVRTGADPVTDSSGILNTPEPSGALLLAGVAALLLRRCRSMRLVANAKDSVDPPTRF